MTKINIKNNKTKIATIALAIIAVSIISLHNVEGQSVTAQNIPTSLAQVTDQYLISITPSKLSEADMGKYQNIILNNNAVKAAIDGKPYKFSSVGFIGNIYNPNNVWYPEIHMTVETNSNLNKDVAIVFDPTTKSITNVQAVEYDPIGDKNTGGTKHTFALQQFGGNSGTPDGVLINMTAPTFTWDSNNRNGFGNVLLLNAIMSGSDTTKLCLPSALPSTYWAQIGEYWESSGKLNWDDNSNGVGCFPQFITSPAYLSGKIFQFRIVGATSGWGLYAIRADTGTTFVTIGPSVNSDQILVGNPNTSAFFENKYLSTDPSWQGQFGGSPSAYHAQYKTTTFGSYSNWSSMTELDVDCNGNPHTYPYTNQVMTGTLASGATAQWSMSKMQTNYPACP